jgi:hypothetical protein
MATRRGTAGPAGPALSGAPSVPMSSVRVVTSGQRYTNEITLSIRKFVLGSFRVFAGLQEELTNNNGGVRDEEYDAYVANLALQSSVLFRENIRTVIADVNLIAESLESVGQDISPLIDVDVATRQIERTWHLCEIYFLNADSKLISLEVARWLKSNSAPVDIDFQLSQVEKDNATRDASTTESSSLYWALIISLVCSGRLRAAASVIAKHSRFAVADVGSLEFRALAALTELFHNHPFSAYVSGRDDDDMVDSDIDYEETLVSRLLAENLTSRLLAWQENCRRIRSQFAGLFTSMGLLMPILSIVETGSCEYSNDFNITTCIDWRMLATMKLLYAYAPPLSRADICAVMDRAVDEFTLHAPAQCSEEETKDQQGFLSTLRGDIGFSLRQMFQYTEHLYRPYQTAAIADTAAPSLSLLSLLCTGQLTFLLSRFAGLTDLLSVLPDSSFGCDLGEEVLLQAAQRLHELDYPVDVIVGYLKSCPTNGMHVASAILPRTVLRNDEVALRLIAILRELGLNDDAITVCRARYSFWLRKKTRYAIFIIR